MVEDSGGWMGLVKDGWGQWRTVEDSAEMYHLLWTIF